MNVMMFVIGLGVGLGLGVVVGAWRLQKNVDLGVKLIRRLLDLGNEKQAREVLDTLDRRRRDR
jgi:hypothetical protein